MLGGPISITAFHQQVSEAFDAIGLTLGLSIIIFPFPPAIKHENSIPGGSIITRQEHRGNFSLISFFLQKFGTLINSLILMAILLIKLLNFCGLAILTNISNLSNLCKI